MTRNIYNDTMARHIGLAIIHATEALSPSKHPVKASNSSNNSIDYNHI
jgi:hypothetical protein